MENSKSKLAKREKFLGKKEGNNSKLTKKYYFPIVEVSNYGYMKQATKGSLGKYRDLDNAFVNYTIDETGITKITNYSQKWHRLLKGEVFDRMGYHMSEERYGAIDKYYWRRRIKLPERPNQYNLALIDQKIDLKFLQETLTDFAKVFANKVESTILTIITIIDMIKTMKHYTVRVINYRGGSILFVQFVEEHKFKIFRNQNLNELLMKGIRGVIGRYEQYFK